MKRDERDLDSLEEQKPRNGRGGLKKRSTEEMERIWDEVQSFTRKGLGWKPPTTEKVLSWLPPLDTSQDRQLAIF